MQENPHNIVLIGPMGSGKTTVGRRLAENLQLDFHDADHEIIDKTGVSIDHIFDVEGEEGFRKRETDVLKELCKDLNIEVQEKNFEPYDVYTADEAFMSGTPFCVLPVTSLNRSKIGSGKPGKIFKKIDEAYDHFSNILHNNDILMVKGSNATGLNQFSKNIKRRQIRAI